MLDLPLGIFFSFWTKFGKNYGLTPCDCFNFWPKFDKNTGYQLAVFKHYVLAQDNFDNIYESMNLEHFGKFLSNSALALGYSAAYIYSKSSDFISGLMSDNLPFSSKADEEYGLFNETYKALENVEDIFV